MVEAKIHDKNDYKLTEDQIADFREAFSLFDKDADGFVSTEQLGLLIQSLNYNPTKAEIKEYISEVDADGQGQFDFPEFISLMARKAKVIQSLRIFQEIDVEEELTEAFKAFDKQGAGFITAVELGHVLKQIGERLDDQEIDQFIKLADPDNSGQIKYADFIKLLTTSYIN